MSASKVKMRRTDHVRLWMALFSAVSLVVVLSAASKPKPVPPKIDPGALNQAVINAQAFDHIEGLDQRLSKIEDVHVEVLASEVKSLEKVGYLIVTVLLGNLLGTVLQIKGQARERRG